MNDWLSVGLGGTFGFDEFNYRRPTRITGITRSNLQEGRLVGPGTHDTRASRQQQVRSVRPAEPTSGNRRRTPRTTSRRDLDDTYLRNRIVPDVHLLPGAAYYFSPKFGAEVMAHAWWTLRRALRERDRQRPGGAVQQRPLRCDRGGWSVNLITSSACPGRRSMSTGATGTLRPGLRDWLHAFRLRTLPWPRKHRGRKRSGRVRWGIPAFGSSPASRCSRPSSFRS